MLSLLLSSSVTLFAAEGSNPWAPSWSMPTDNKQSKTKPSREGLSKNTPLKMQPMWSFVTPELLDSLKQQQMQFQSMSSQLIPQMRPSQRRMVSSRSCTEQSQPLQVQPNLAAVTIAPEVVNFGRAEMPSWPNMSSPAGSYRMNDNLVYDTPVVSPWGQGADVLYRGESFPKQVPGALPPALGGQFPGMVGESSWVPNEAVGGLLPMPVSAAGLNEYKINKLDEVENVTKRKNSAVNNVFNPFTFLPGDNWH